MQRGNCFISILFSVFLFQKSISQNDGLVCNVSYLSTESTMKKLSLSLNRILIVGAVAVKTNGVLCFSITSSRNSRERNSRANNYHPDK